MCISLVFYFLSETMGLNRHVFVQAGQVCFPNAFDAGDTGQTFLNFFMAQIAHVHNTAFVMFSK